MIRREIVSTMADCLLLHDQELRQAAMTKLARFLLTECGQETETVVVILQAINHKLALISVESSARN